MEKIYGKALFIAFPVRGLSSKPSPGEEPRRVALGGSGGGMALATATSRSSYWKNTRKADTETCWNWQEGPLCEEALLSLLLPE